MSHRRIPGLVSEAHRASLLQWCWQVLPKQTTATGWSLLTPAIASWGSGLDTLELSYTRKILVQYLYFSNGENEVLSVNTPQEHAPGFLTPGTVFCFLIP